MKLHVIEKSHKVKYREYGLLRSYVAHYVYWILSTQHMTSELFVLKL
jgi:hypothetical protein